MRGRLLIAVSTILFPVLFASPSYSQGEDIYWHIDPSVEECSMVIDPSLTQSQWETFTRQAGAIISFKSLTPAEPIGRLKYTLGIEYSATPVDQHDPAWINTFTHPDADCPLGDQIEIPTIRGRMGVSRTMDVAAYWTTAPGANYGMIGGEFKYAFLKETPKVPAAAVTASGTWLTGVPDFNFSVYSVGVSASKRIAMFTPYVGVREALAIGTETTSKVNLDQEIIPFTQGFVGMTYSIWMIGLGAEYDIADVNTFSLVLGFQP